MDGFMVNGHEVTFDGTLTMAFRVNEQKELIAFEGQNCSQVEIDGQLYKFSNSPVHKIAFAPSFNKNSNEILLTVHGESKVSIPLPMGIGSKKLTLKDGGGKKVKFVRVGDAIQIDVNNKLSGKLLTISWQS